MLSRAVEDAGTVTSPLVPWNSCGAYMAGVLGVATVAYLLFCFFNLLSPVISLIYGFTGFRIEHIRPTAGSAGPTGSGPGRSDAVEPREDAAMTAAATAAPTARRRSPKRGLRAAARPTRSCSS